MARLTAIPQIADSINFSCYQSITTWLAGWQRDTGSGSDICHLGNTMNNNSQEKLEPNVIVDSLYDIALDPSSLNAFINTWCDAGLDTLAARQMMESIDRFDEAHQTHLKRADTFLKRGIATEEATDLSADLIPFENLAAFIVDANLRIVVANDGAKHSFAMNEGDTVDQAVIAPDALVKTLKATLSSHKPTQHLLKVVDATAANPAVFQIRK